MAHPHMKLVAAQALYVAQAAYSAAWRPIMEAIGNDKEEEYEKARKLAFTIEQAFNELGAYLRKD